VKGNSCPPVPPHSAAHRRSTQNHLRRLDSAWQGPSAAPLLCFLSSVLTPLPTQRFPDALSKTIPLWCAVLNRARINLLPPSPDNSNVSLEDWEAEGKLFTAPQSVGRSEHSQIEVKIDGWAEDLAVRSFLSSLSVADHLNRTLSLRECRTYRFCD
jgi:hypothetical protein